MKSCHFSVILGLDPRTHGKGAPSVATNYNEIQIEQVFGQSSIEGAVLWNAL
jgi:hypothetical protein